MANKSFLSVISLLYNPFQNMQTLAQNVLQCARSTPVTGIKQLHHGLSACVRDN